MSSEHIICYDPWLARRIGLDVLSTEALQAYQCRRINEVIARAQTQSPFYRKHLRAVQPLNTLTDLATLPFIFPEDIRSQGLQMLCVSQGDISRVVSLSTSGTTGEPKQLYFTAPDQEYTVDFFAASMARLTKPYERAIILFPCVRPGGIGQLLTKAIASFQAIPIQYGLVSNLPELIALLAEAPVACIVGVPVQILALARYSAAHAIPLTINNVLLASDYVPTSLRQEIERLWHCHAYEYYGMTEAGLGGGMDCEEHCGCHLHEADVYIEIVDPESGRVVSDGQEGEVVLTTLMRSGMPLIRYRTGDIASLVPGRCACGSLLRRLTKIKARKHTRRVLGTHFLNMSDLDEVLFAVPSVVNIKAILHEQTHSQGRAQRLEIELLELGQPCDLEQVRHMLIEQIPALQEAVQHVGLTLQLRSTTVTDYIEATAAKRQIVVQNDV